MNASKDPERHWEMSRSDLSPKAGWEIRDLARELDAVETLETATRVFDGTDVPLDHGYRPTHFLIRFNRKTRTSTVDPYNLVNGTRSYDEAERDLNITESDDEDVVLVDVGKIETLREAYPNYFGDVSRFKMHLKGIVQGADAFEFIAPPRAKVAPQGRSPVGDLSWLRGARFSGPSLRKRR